MQPLIIGVMSSKSQRNFRINSMNRIIDSFTRGDLIKASDMI
jgi:hypothetical protein